MDPIDKEIYEIMKQNIRNYALEAIQLKKELETLKTEVAQLREARDKSYAKTLLILANLKQ